MDTPLRTLLQLRQRRLVRRHLARGVLRVLALLGADGIALLLLKTVSHGLRDSLWLGAGFGSFVDATIPRGTVSGGGGAMALILGLFVLGNYGSGDLRRDPAKLAAGISLGYGLVFWSTFWGHPDPWIMVGFGCAIALTTLVLASERTIIDYTVRGMRVARTANVRAVLIGSPVDVRTARRHPALADPGEFNVLGWIDSGPKPESDALGGLADLEMVIEHGSIDTLVLAGMLDHEAYAYVLQRADVAGAHVFALPRAFQHGHDLTMVWRRGFPMLQLTRPALRGGQLFLKRVLDITVAGGLLVVLSPVFAAVALAVKLTSRGSLFFRQVRVGQGGERFAIFKFRSMVLDAESRLRDLKASNQYTDGRLFKMKNDPRVTPIGSFLRRSSLDELPQLWNVLRGDMALVGPRPPLPSEVELYEEHHYARFDMKPGITGPWQVSGRNRITDFEEVVNLECAYMRNWTIWKDFVILSQTLPAVLRMDGAH